MFAHSLAEWPDPDRRDVALTRLLARVDRPLPSRSLTAKERWALQAAAAGLGWRESADMLGVQPDTVSSSLRRARRVLAAKNTTHAVAIALRRGLIT